MSDFNKNDYLAHRDHKYIKREWKNGRYVYTYANTKGGKSIRTSTGDGISKTYLDYNNGDGWSDKVGVSINKNKGQRSITLFNTKNTKYFDNDEDTSKINKEYGPFTVSYAEDGVEYKLDVEQASKTVSSINYKLKKTGESFIRNILKIH